MRKERPFDIAKTRTSKGDARVREQLTMNAMDMLTAINNQEAFEELLDTNYGIKPGDPRYAAALSAWNSAQASKPQHHSQKKRVQRF
jgi:hypothetical protein